MKKLADAGLVTRTQRGKCAYYRIVPGALMAIGQALVPADPISSTAV